MGIDATLRPGLAAFLIAFAVALFAGPTVIARLRVLKFGQPISSDGPASHQKKQGTPTMGGLLLVLGVLVAMCIAIVGHVSRGPVLAVGLVFLAHAALGGADDYLKITRGKSLGLKARQKLAGQLIIALAFVAWLSLTAQPNFTTVLTFGRAALDLGWGYYVLVVILMIGLSNATNLTDGLDGLAGGLAMLTALGLAWTVYTLKPGYDLLPVFACAVAGACGGFLWYNAHPARVFMGDTGSLALGSSFAALGIIGKQEILLLVFALVFIAETVSVMIQVSVFKATGGKAGGGRRVFHMTPLHHHFELGGMPETQVVARFWLVGLLALAAGLLVAPHISPFDLGR